MKPGRKYPKIIVGARDIALRQRPNKKPPEENMSVSTCRVLLCFPDNTAHRLESGLEAAAMDMFAANNEVVKIQTQFGPVTYVLDGVEHKHYVDICVDFRNGARIFYSVRAKENLGDLVEQLQHIRNQSLKLHAHEIHLLTEQQISKPAVYLSQQKVRSRKWRNEDNNGHLLQALEELGGSAVIFDIFHKVEAKMSFADVWEAVWALLEDGLILHDHSDPKASIMTRLSTICIAKEFGHGSEKAKGNSVSGSTG
jgi:hypothetical protein